MRAVPGGQRLFRRHKSPGREYVWQKCKQSYYDKGVRIFWLDEAEPNRCSILTTTGMSWGLLSV